MLLLRLRLRARLRVALGLRLRLRLVLSRELLRGRLDGCLSRSLLSRRGRRACLRRLLRSVLLYWLTSGALLRLRAALWLSLRLLALWWLLSRLASHLALTRATHLALLLLHVGHILRIHRHRLS